ncbi:MAG: hypothetical protein AABW90_01390, partial [Nanoarchaeota archaeon]
DLHRTDIDSYNNVLIISNSCWQSMTAFEEKMGNVPDPCKVPILNLKTGQVRILDFSGDEVSFDNKDKEIIEGVVEVREVSNVKWEEGSIEEPVDLGVVNEEAVNFDKK